MVSEEELHNELNCAAEHVIQLLIDRSLWLAVSESCTGGLVAEALTRISGASSCFWGSFVCYTARAKMHMLGVGEDTLNAYGAVSRETAMAMAVGALKKSGADAAVSITGIAGPDGDGSAVPVGTVWIAAALRKGNSAVRDFHFDGSRDQVRMKAAKEALMQIAELI